MVFASLMDDRCAGVGQAVERLLEDVGVCFERELRSDVLAVEELCAHVERYRGKMLRPMLVGLSGMCVTGGEAVQDEHAVLGAVVEMVHMATLVHDDVLDEAASRRGGATVNSLRGNEAAVILGDYLFSAAYRLCATLGSQEASELIARTGMTLCSGELVQLRNREHFSLDRETYFEIVRRKTASLIEAACWLGARQSGGSDEQCAAVAGYGRELGVAFQIQDDLLDLLGEQAVVGKPTLQDVGLGKMTLPVIVFLEQAEAQERGRMLMLLEAVANRPEVGVRIAEMLQESGAVDAARQEAGRRVEAAVGMLGKLGASPAREAMELMAKMVVERNH